MKDARTDDALLEALKQAAGREITADEIHNQKVSFIIGSSGADSKITREIVEAQLARMAGTPSES